MSESHNAGAPAIDALRPFVPATDFQVSLSFYEALGFEATRLGDRLAALQYGDFGFLLQGFYAKDFAENFMLQVLTSDLDAWWARIKAANLKNRFSVKTPAAPKLQPWGLMVAYVFDPSGVLWHFTQRPAPAQHVDQTQPG